MTAPAPSDTAPVVPQPPAPAPAPAPQDAPVAAAPTWATLREGLPEEVRVAPFMQNHESFESFAREAIGQNRLIGMEKIARPGAESSSEDWALFYDAMGRPESAGQYDLGDFQKPEGEDWTDEFQSGLLEDMHSVGASNNQVNAILRKISSRQVEESRLAGERMQEHRNAAITTLRDAWGAAYEGRERVALKTFEHIFGENSGPLSAVVLPDGMTFGNHPAVIEAMWEVGSRMQEGGLIGDKALAEPSLSPVQALAEIGRMEADASIVTELAAGDKNNAHVQRWNRLYEFAHPNE